MSKKKCCCGGDEPIRADCDVTGCIRVSFSGISAFKSETAFINLQSPTSNGLFRVLSLADVNRTVFFNYPNPSGYGFTDCSSGYVQTQDAGVCSNPQFDIKYWNNGLRIDLGLNCIANRLRIERLRVSVGQGGSTTGSGCGNGFPNRFAGGTAFDFWPSFLGIAQPLIGFGTTITNRNASISPPGCNQNGTSDILALNGQATVQMFPGTCPGTPTVYAVAERCGDPASRISVDPAGILGTADKCYFGGNLYRLTDDTTTAAPVAVTWTADECPESKAALITRGQSFLRASMLPLMAPGSAARPGGLRADHVDRLDPSAAAHIEKQRRASGCRGCGDAAGSDLI
jgi:hypothetical protein